MLVNLWYGTSQRFDCSKKSGMKKAEIKRNIESILKRLTTKYGKIGKSHESAGHPKENGEIVFDLKVLKNELLNLGILEKKKK